MRRIDAPRANLNDGSKGMVACRTITERDYRLLLAVARAVDRWYGDHTTVNAREIGRCIDKLNAKPRKP